MKQIVPSLLSADFANLESEVKVVEDAGAERIHFDVMDGHFVPNLTFGAPVLKAIRGCTELHLEAHLMITNPEDLIGDFVKAGADTIMVHAEVVENLSEVIDEIKNFGIEAGVALNPPSELSLVEDVLGDIDLLLVMTVNPGFGEQSMIKKALEKVRVVKEQMGDSAPLIEIDGGVNLETVVEASAAGSDLLVSGSSVFGAEDVKARFDELTKLANSF